MTSVQPGPQEPAVQRLRVRYAKRGRMRFASHRDLARAVERAIRRGGIPVAFSAGFAPHPKISYAGAAPTGVASEAEYLEIAVTRPCDPERVRADLNAALPEGLDVLEIVEAEAGALTDRLTASEWQVRLDGVAPEAVEQAVTAFLAADRVETERLTKKGRRRLDVRAAVVACTLDRRATEAATVPCAILRMVVRHMTPAVRPDDVLAGLRQVADLAPPSPPVVTRLVQGLLDEASGGLADPFAPDREHRPGTFPPIGGPTDRRAGDRGIGEDDVAGSGDGAAESAAAADVVGARPHG